MKGVLQKAATTLDIIRVFAAEKEYFYFDPLVNFTEDKEVVFEWWLSTKKLSFYITLDKIEYFKTWGIVQAEGQVELPKEIEELWEWLVRDATKRFDLPAYQKDS